jgi:hypothetical protein
VTRAQLLADLREARAKLNDALGPLNEARLDELGPGDWRLQDLLTHMTGWAVDLLTNLGKVQRGQKPGKTQWTDPEIEEQNQKWTKEFYSRPAAAVLADFHGVYEQLLRKAQAFSDVELAAPAAWLQGRSIEDYFRSHVVNHEQEHAAELAHWQAEPGK